MALTLNHKIYYPDINDRAQARTQMHAMASSVESAINSLRESLNAPLENILARIVEMESRPGGAGGGGGATIISITTEDNELVIKMSDGRVLRTSMATNPDGDLSIYVERVEAAQATADAANAALQNLTSELETAQSAVNEVANRTGAVESALADTDAKATQAALVANNATNAAQSALAAAEQVQADAQNALTKAEEAETKALEVAGIAAGKGKIIYSASAPSGSEANSNNLWIRSSDSKPHRWDGTRWIAVTDKAILDAAAAADNAQSTATKAVADATSAASVAHAASIVATDAHLTAGKAVSDASIAQAAAEEAERKALEAAGIAAGKGKVIYGGTAPTGSDAAAENLWIRSSDNRPHRWDGTRWVEVTDAAVVASAAAASAAQAKADKAERDAAAAQVAADTAQAAANAADNKAAAAAQAANAAQTTANKAVSDASTAQAAANAADAKALQAAGVANGKGKVIYSTTAPGTADRLTQNLWISLPDNTPHRWSGSAWVAVTDKTATDAASSAAAANALASQAKAAADKAQADATSAATAAQDAMRAANQAQDSANGKNTVSYTTGTPAGVGTRVGDTHYQVNAAGTVLRWWRWSGTAWVEQALDGQVISSLDAGKITAGTLDAARIKAGSITGDKINAQSVAAAVGTFVKVNAENVGVSGELAARVVNAMTAQVKNLVVTESAILQHSTLLGNTTAEHLNVTKKLVARDAIVDGTLDVAQLNVTEQMAAEIVNAMSVNAKKLVVTDDAIMNQLTVIQNIVTPELIAERINVKNLGAALVTAGALQTDDAANRGVKITSTGINAWDMAGRQTIRLNGVDNLISGALETGSTTEGRMRAFNFTNPVNSRPQGVITLSSTPQGQGKQGVMKFDADLLTLEVKPNGTQDHTGRFEKGLMIGENSVFIRGDLSLDGAFLPSQAMQRGGMTGPNIPPGEVRTWNVSYPTRFDSRVGIRVLLSPVTDTGAAIAYGISNSTHGGFTIRIKNTDSIGTGNLWLQWIAIGII